MTSVHASAGKRLRCVTLAGHATGSEQVCAAISGIVLALAGYLANDKRAKVLDYKVESGDVSLVWKGRKQDLAALRMACIGLMQLEEKEPGYLKTDISEKIFEKFP